MAPPVFRLYNEIDSRVLTQGDPYYDVLLPIHDNAWRRLSEPDSRETISNILGRLDSTSNNPRRYTTTQMLNAGVERYLMECRNDFPEYNLEEGQAAMGMFPWGVVRRQAGQLRHRNRGIHHEDGEGFSLRNTLLDMPTWVGAKSLAPNVLIH